jgi:hypothetical protein
MSIHLVEIVHAAAWELVRAELHDELGMDALLDIEDGWADPRESLRQKLRTTNVPRSEWPQSLHWDWSRKSLQLTLGGTSNDTFRLFGIRCQDSWEALMLTQKTGWTARRAPDAGKPLILFGLPRSCALELDCPGNRPSAKIQGTGTSAAASGCRAKLRNGT